MESNRAHMYSDEVRSSAWFVRHPWVSLIAFLVLSVVVLGVMGTLFSRGFGLPPDSRTTGFLNSLTSHIIILFIIAPFVLRLPRGSRSFRGYLDDIGLTNVEPLGRLVLLALSTYVILAVSQATGSVVYRISQGLPLTGTFLVQVFGVTHDLPPDSLSAVYSLPSALEEVGSRGVILTLFMLSYSKRTSILIAAAGFSVLHLLNLLGGREPVWVLGQLGWSFLMGIFYGYLFVRTRSLVPSMLVHYLGNVFVGSFAGYMQGLASVEMQALYGVTFTFGVVPVVLMILWVRYFAQKWPLDEATCDKKTDGSMAGAV
jgi:membrane protease YdiL (CAAX protease family)